jgi:hypothetical protein
MSPDLRVDVGRVIAGLKLRLAEEITKVVMLEVALAESQERERAQSLVRGEASQAVTP